MTILYASFRCKIVKDTVKTSVCVTVEDMELDKKCELIQPDPTPPAPTITPDTCFKKDCKMMDTVKLVKECEPVSYEECDVVIEEIVKKECKNITTTSTEQKCEDKKEKKCRQDFVYVCQEKYGYTPKPSYHPTPKPAYHTTPVPHHGMYGRNQTNNMF